MKHLLTEVLTQEGDHAFRCVNEWEKRHEEFLNMSVDEVPEARVAQSRERDEIERQLASARAYAEGMQRVIERVRVQVLDEPGSTPPAKDDVGRATVTVAPSGLPLDKSYGPGARRPMGARF